MKLHFIYSAFPGAGIMVLIIITLLAFTNSEVGSIKLADKGIQPDITITQNGHIQVIYGVEDKIFHTSSTDQGLTFSAPQLVAQLPGLHLGMTRGPRIASTGDYIVVTAVNKQGNVYAYQLDPKTQQWSVSVQINDINTVAKEGFVVVAGADKNKVHAAWLDLRGEGGQKIYGAVSKDGGKTWSGNLQLYQSPEGTVCQCCRPSLVANNKGPLALMFRNWLNGSRDLYLMQSSNEGATFGEAQKLGFGTWPLKGCPMDGGDISLDMNGNVVTVWKRKKEIFLSEPGKAEVSLGQGPTPTVAVTRRTTLVAWQKNGEIIVQSPTVSIESLGKGAYPQFATSQHQDYAVVVWEADGQIMLKKWH
jgi:hypothetical protein